MRYLLDTGTCVFALRGDESMRQRFGVVAPEAMTISVVRLAELRDGATRPVRPEANYQCLPAPL
jgi:predicted nucleic acid-binding protein